MYHKFIWYALPYKLVKMPALQKENTHLSFKLKNLSFKLNMQGIYYFYNKTLWDTFKTISARVICKSMLWQAFCEVLM